MTAERLYDLLPAIVRLRDARDGNRVLEALLGIVQGQSDRLADDLDGLLDDWFIETCKDWVVPYIGELVSARAHYAFGDGALSLRSFVANTLNFRRRKGTASMLEDLATSVTGWTCRAVEMFQYVATTQHLDHVRRDDHWTPDLRRTEPLDRIGGAFDPTHRSVDVRSIAAGRGRYNVPSVALFLWRLIALEATRTAAVPDASAGPGRFRFDPLGADRPIGNPARTLADLSRSVTEPDVPAPARRRPVFDELVAARAAITAGAQATYRYFADTAPLVRITPVGGTALRPDEIQICNLDSWTTLPAPITVTPPVGPAYPTRAVLDPTTGRFAFHGAAPAAVQVTYYYALPALVGGGHYTRGPRDAAADQTLAVADWTQPASTALVDALAAWPAAPGAHLVLEIADSGSYSVPASTAVPAGAHLTIRSADVQRAMLRAGAAWQLTLGAGATLVLDGIWLTGGALQLTIDAAAGPAARVELHHTTLVPGSAQTAAGAPTAPGAEMLATTAASAGVLELTADRCVLGRVDLTRGVAGFLGDAAITDSVVDDAVDDSATPPAEALRAHGLSIERSTVLGATHARTLTASDVVFQRPVTVERTQDGCVRFSFVPAHSKTPRAYRCQPALALAAPGADPVTVAARIVPTFVTARFGAAAYPRLADTTPAEILTGGSDGSEIGVHFHLHQPQREANLRMGLDEYLRFGLEAGLVFVS